MKHLLKFNENISQSLLDLLEEEFSDLLEQGYEFEYDNEIDCYQMEIELDDLSSLVTNLSLNELHKHYEELIKIIEMIQLSVERIKIFNQMLYGRRKKNK